MRDVFVIGTHCTTFGQKPTESFKDLTRETYLGVLADVGWEHGGPIDFVYFGNCAMHGVKQGTIRGQVCTIELVDDGLLPRRTPLINVEGGCATGSRWSAVFTAPEPHIWCSGGAAPGSWRCWR